MTLDSMLADFAVKECVWYKHEASEFGVKSELILIFFPPKCRRKFGLKVCQNECCAVNG